MKGHLHDIVYFIGDKPSPKNLRPDLPFVGTASYKTLLGWIADANIDVSRVRFFNQSTRPFDGDAQRFLRNIKIVALGKEAAEYLNSTDIKTYFQLPHPSPANQATHKDIKDKLDKCKDYVYSK